MSARAWFWNWWETTLPSIRTRSLRDWIVVALIVLLLALLPLALDEAQWLQSSAVLWWAFAGGIAWGLLLARIVRRPGMAALGAIVVGVAFISQFQSRALPPIDAAVRELEATARWMQAESTRRVAESLNLVSEEVPHLPLPALPEWKAAGERLYLYGWNLRTDWPLQLVVHRWQRGQVLLGSVLGLTVWVALAWAVWSLARRRAPWEGSASVLALLAANVYYTSTGWLFLVAAASLGFFLVCEARLRCLEGRWKQSFPDGVTIDWWFWGVTCAVLIGLGMLLAIGVTDPEFRRYIHDRLTSRREASDSAGASSSGARSQEQAWLGVWPRQHLLRAGPESRELPVMFVRTPGAPPAHFYWRATSYDEYTGSGWIRNTSGIELAAALWPASPDPPEHFALLQQSFRMVSSTHQIYAAGRPVRLNQSASGFWFDRGGLDLVSVESITAQSAYQVLSWVPAASPDDLRGASEKYPTWLAEGYLKLPPELPERVIALAREIAGNALTNYDKALALQNYLRGYEYTLDLDDPPQGRDVVDYFLFDLRKGYCDYYASAMVVMARSVGLPARLTAGYATGEYIPATQEYRVTQANAHSWVEIYFPEFGWIPFEPTAALSEIDHGLTGVAWTVPPRPEELEAFGEPEKTAAEIGLGKLWPLVAIPAVLAIAVVAAGLTAALRAYRRRRSSPQQIVASLYRDLRVWGDRLGVPLSDTQTPYEFLAVLRAEMSARSKNAPRWMDGWAARTEFAWHAVGDLVLAYVNSCYSPRPPTPESAQTLLGSWPALNRALWTLWLITRRSQTSGMSLEREASPVAR